MCPERVCRGCGKPSRRIVGEASYVRQDGTEVEPDPWPWGGNETGKRGGRVSNDGQLTKVAPTLGWTDCGHDDYRPGLVFDPFCGSGTTLQVATRLGRDAVGIDLDPRNEALVQNRVGLFLDGVESVDNCPRKA
jgi:SAM-dependent methyltransferase